LIGSDNSPGFIESAVKIKALSFPIAGIDEVELNLPVVPT
jgi:hypothetical protein